MDRTVCVCVGEAMLIFLSILAKGRGGVVSHVSNLSNKTNLVNSTIFYLLSCKKLSFFFLIFCKRKMECVPVGRHVDHLSELAL